MAMDDSTDKFMEKVKQIRIGDRYQLVRRLGAGSFGAVYLGMLPLGHFETFSDGSQGKTCSRMMMWPSSSNTTGLTRPC